MVGEREIRRHFTVTGFVIEDGKVLLHWHPKVEMWLPPGGHIEANEDPVEAVVREIYEETNLITDVVPTGTVIALGYPPQVTAPFTIMIEDINDPIDGFHHHIDMIYFCRVRGSVSEISPDWVWVTEFQLHSNVELLNYKGDLVEIPEDVRKIARYAFEYVDASRVDTDPI